MILKMNQVILASSTQTVVSLPHTDGQSVGDLTEELQSDAASHFVILPSAYCIMDTLPSDVTISTICSCQWFVVQEAKGGQEGENAGGLFIFRLSPCCQTGWIKMSYEKEHYRGYNDSDGDGLKERNGNVSFMWRPFESTFMLRQRFSPSLGNCEKIRPGFGRREIEPHRCWHLKQINDHLLKIFC